MYTLQNDLLKISVAERGAELKSITELADGTEYLFDGDPTWWKFSSPVLFPIVGKVNGNKYRAEGREFTLPGHGFARTTDFWLVDATDNALTFALESNAATFKVYPYEFRLEISFKLTGNEVKVGWKVVNVDDKDIYFSIGAHPALSCPINYRESFEDCYLKFNRAEKSSRIPLTSRGTLSHDRIPTLDGTELPLTYDLFKGDALVFDDLKSDEVSVCSRKSAKTITVRAKGFPYWGFWTPNKGGAPFICIEPWHGHADYEDFQGELKDKEGIIKLAAGAKFETEMSFIIGKADDSN
ncbi:MAG: aldose 1-epimerase family protein [Selenomonadaceae bacterium]|nr:aldose 1-epimerase family protein [Selenomonadaceae bacterium]MBR0102614.1 aldose 1-epimerase family protein [Selenomonadaceae bacterium]